MNKGLLIAVAGGLALAALLFGGIVYWRGGDRVAPAGHILKIRSVPADEQRSLLVLDVRIVNDSNITLEARQVSLTLETKDGLIAEGRLVSGVDTRQLFSYYPALGQAYNEPLIAGSRVAPHQTADFMLAAQVDVAEPELKAVRKLSVEVIDRTGAKVQLRVNAK